MAFQDDVRAEMLVPIVEDMCCERAALATAILASGGVSFAGLGKIHLTVASGRATVVRRFFEIAKTCCGASGELRAAKTEKLSKTTRYELHLDADTLVDQLGLSDPDSLFGIRQTAVSFGPSAEFRCQTSAYNTCNKRNRKAKKTILKNQIC